MNILSNFSNNKSAIEEVSDLVIDKLSIKVLSLCDTVENKIIPLTVSANLLTILLDDDKIYSSTVLEEGKTVKINKTILAIS